MIVKCPTCKKPASFEATNRFRPFCSERCQTLDLGAWADEQYTIPVNQLNPADEQNRETVNEFSPGDAKSNVQRPPKHQLN